MIDLWLWVVIRIVVIVGIITLLTLIVALIGKILSWVHFDERMNWEEEKKLFVRSGRSIGLSDIEMDNILIAFKARYYWLISNSKPLPLEIVVPISGADNELYRTIEFPKRIYKKLLGLSSFFE